MLIFKNTPGNPFQRKTDTAPDLLQSRKSIIQRTTVAVITRKIANVRLFVTRKENIRKNDVRLFLTHGFSKKRLPRSGVIKIGWISLNVLKKVTQMIFTNVRKNVTQDPFTSSSKRRLQIPSVI